MLVAKKKICRLVVFSFLFFSFFISLVSIIVSYFFMPSGGLDLFSLLLIDVVKITVVGLFLCLLIERLVSRHLIGMANFVSGFDLNSDAGPLKLNRYYKKKRKSLDELDLVENAINDMHGKLRQNYSDLQITEGNLRELSLKLIHSQEQERERISRDLHDDIGQKLTVLKLNFAKHFRRLDMTEKDLQVRRAIIFSEIDEVANGIRHVAKSLLPSILYDFGVIDAVRWLLEESFRHSSTEFHAELSLEIEIEDKKLSLTIFRIIQESLNNIIKYADAKYVEVKLFTDNNNIIVEITDDGIGITHEDMAKSKSTGIMSIKERLRPYEGELEINMREVGGTESKIRIPLRHIW